MPYSRRYRGRRSRANRFSVPIKTRRPNYKRRAFKKSYRKTPKRRLNTKLNVKDKHFFLSPQSREVALTLVNDEPLILKRPTYQQFQERHIYGHADTGSSTMQESDTGPAETHFRFSPAIDAVHKQLTAYRELYKEICICGVTLTFTPTWTRRSLTSGLKLTQILQDRITDASWTGAEHTHEDIDTTQFPMQIHSQGRIPYGLFPRLYWKHCDYGTSQDPSSIMCNKQIAMSMNAKSMSLSDGKKKTIKFVPKMFKTFRTTDGMEVSKPVTAGWFPTDDIHKRQLGGVDILITPFPNFDYSIMATDPKNNDGSIATHQIPDHNTETVTDTLNPDIKGQAPYHDDGVEFNDQYVIVNRIYHIKLRGRKNGAAINSFTQGTDIQPTHLYRTNVYNGKNYANENLPGYNIGIPQARGTGFGDITVQTFPQLPQNIYLGAKQDAVNPVQGKEGTVITGEPSAKRKRTDEIADEGNDSIAGQYHSPLLNDSSVTNDATTTGVGYADMGPKQPSGAPNQNSDFASMNTDD